MASDFPKRGKVNRNFKYYGSLHTDLRRTFARVRRELREAAERQPTNVRRVK